MDDEAPKWAIEEDDGGGSAASVVNTGAANATCHGRVGAPKFLFYLILSKDT